MRTQINNKMGSRQPLVIARVLLTVAFALTFVFNARAESGPSCRVAIGGQSSPSHAKSVTFRAFDKAEEKVEDHKFGLDVLHDAVTKNPIDDLEISVVETDPDGKSGLYVDPKLRTFQAYIQDPRRSEASKRRALELILKKRDEVRAAIKASFRRVVSTNFATVDLHEYGQFEVFQDRVFDERGQLGSFYIGIQSMTFNPEELNHFVLNFPAFFRAGTGPKKLNVEPRLKVTARDEISQTILSQQIARSANKDDLRKRQHLENIQRDAEAAAKRKRIIEEFLKMYGAVLSNASLSSQETAQSDFHPGPPRDLAPQTVSILEWLPQNLISAIQLASGSRVKANDLNELFSLWRGQSESRIKNQFERLKTEFIYIESKIGRAHLERYKTVRDALLALVAYDLKNEARIEAIVPQLRFKSDDENWVRHAENVAVSMIQSLALRNATRPSLVVRDQDHVSPQGSQLLRDYATMADVEADFDVLARKTALDDKSVAEVDVAATDFSRGVPSYRIYLEGTRVRFFTDVAEKVFAIGSRGALDFAGRRSRGSAADKTDIRLYAVLFPKGFIANYGQPTGMPRVISDEAFEKIRRPDKLFKVVFEKATAEFGQIHVNLNQRRYQIGDRLVTPLDFVRENALAVLEFDVNGRVLSKFVLPPR